jgi:suppressor for copper-sensitivity B
MQQLYRLILLVFFLPLTAHAATGDWFQTEQARVRLITASQKEIGVEFSLRPGWKIYWRTPGDSGAPTSIVTDNLTNISAASQFWPLPQRHEEAIGEDIAIQTFGYMDHVIFPLTLTPADPNAPIGGNLAVSFAICKEICLFYDTTLPVAIAPGYEDAEALATLNAAKALVPHASEEEIALRDAALYRDNTEHYHLELTVYAKQWEAADIFVEGFDAAQWFKPEIGELEGGLLRAVIPLKASKEHSPENRDLTLTVINGSNAREIALNTGTIATAPSVPIKAAESYEELPETSPLWLMLLYGVLGGMILNIMPCVLPVLALKLLSMLKHGGKELSHARGFLLLSASGIIVSFLTLAGATVALKEAGNAVGWGIHFQNPYIVIGLLSVVLLFAANLLGKFEIRLPALFGDIAVNAPDKHQGTALGHFLTGAFAAILATPCTAPFLGIAVSFALLRGTFEIVSIFAAMGIGMAFPYLFFAAFPRLVTCLPKPGAWMVKVKYVLAFLLLLTAGWLVWVVAGQLGFWPSLLLMLLGILVPFWCERLSGAPALVMVLLTLGLMFYLPTALAHRDKAADHRIDALWKPFAPEAIDGLVAEEKIVVVDVTADWCLTCKTNKLLVLDRTDVMERLEADDIVAMRADMTNPDPVIAAFLKQHKRYGIPFNIVYGKKAPEGIILPPLLTREVLFEAIGQAK